MSNMSPLSFFKEIVRIPRDTGDEKQISDYLMDFASQRGLSAFQDNAYNVVIKKPATAGFEAAPPLALQSHIDIVYIKTEGSSHNYNTPLELIEEDGILRANGTSLGADNGIGVAYMLALLDSTTLKHPPLECLFTTGEEAGMLGAMKLSPDTLQARRMINLDSEDEGIFIAGCAGGQRVVTSLDMDWVAPAADKGCYLLQIQGLLGGHSGIDIDKGRGNSIRLLGRTLNEVARQLDIQVGAVDGGAKMNAIPDRSSAYLFIAQTEVEKLQAIITQCNEVFANELSGADPNISLTLSPCAYEGLVMHSSDLDKLLLLLLNIPVGVQSMSAHLPGLPESSNNIGVLRTQENKVEICCAIRSSVGSLKQAIFTQIDSLGKSVGAKVSSDSSYPEWSYMPVSPLRETSISVYSELTGSEPEVQVIHAGLECGYFCALFPGMDVISIGPDICDVHTPSEKADIASMERTWHYLISLIASL